jgi:hypothetical protein
MIFTPSEWYDMAAAAERLGQLAPTGARLTDLAYRIGTLDDPYYSRLSGRTYMAAARLASPSRIAELVEIHGS